MRRKKLALTAGLSESAMDVNRIVIRIIRATDFAFVTRLKDLHLFGSKVSRTSYHNDSSMTVRILQTIIILSLIHI